MIVAADTPSGILKDAVQRLVGRLQRARLRHVVTHGEHLQLRGIDVGKAADLHIAEAMRHKRGHPTRRSCFQTTAHVNILATGRPQVVGIEGRIALQPLGKA